jgi:hypothetical protein
MFLWSVAVVCVCVVACSLWGLWFLLCAMGFVFVFVRSCSCLLFLVSRFVFQHCHCMSCFVFSCFVLRVSCSVFHVHVACFSCFVLRASIFLSLSLDLGLLFVVRV